MYLQSKSSEIFRVNNGIRKFVLNLAVSKLRKIVRVSQGFIRNKLKQSWHKYFQKWCETIGNGGYCSSFMYWYFSAGVFHILNLKFSKILTEHLKGQSRRPKHRKRDNIKIYLKETRLIMWNYSVVSGLGHFPDL